MPGMGLIFSPLANSGRLILRGFRNLFGREATGGLTNSLLARLPKAENRHRTWPVKHNALSIESAIGLNKSG
jgi:hypothetical protein